MSKISVQKKKKKRDAKKKKTKLIDSAEIKYLIQID